MRRLLIVDDEPDIRLILTAGLSTYGLEVRAAPDVDQAIELLRDWRPDAILCDFLMPVRDGGALLEHVRDRHPDLLARGGFYFLTGEPEAVLLRSELPSVPVICKPARLSDLAERLGLEDPAPAVTSCWAPAAPRPSGRCG